MLTAGKVCVVRTNALLAHELVSAEPAIAQSNPHFPFGRGRCTPECASTLHLGQTDAAHARAPTICAFPTGPSPYLSPLRRGEGASAFAPDSCTPRPFAGEGRRSNFIVEPDRSRARDI